MITPFRLAVGAPVVGTIFLIAIPIARWLVAGMLAAGITP